jgi:hypothetical protein
MSKNHDKGWCGINASQWGQRRHLVEVGVFKNCEAIFFQFEELRGGAPLRGKRKTCSEPQALCGFFRTENAEQGWSGEVGNKVAVASLF